MPGEPPAHVIPSISDRAPGCDTGLIEFSNFQGPGTGFAAYDGTLSQTTVPRTGNGIYALTDVASGPFDGFFVQALNGASFHYEWQIDVLGDSSGSGVPAPSGVALLGFGLLALARSRRRS